MNKSFRLVGSLRQNMLYGVVLLLWCHNLPQQLVPLFKLLCHLPRSFLNTEPLLTLSDGSLGAFAALSNSTTQPILQ